jgi:death on curing protein
VNRQNETVHCPTGEPFWISVAEAEAIHIRQLAEHGGGTGTRDRGLLESALARPQFVWQYGDPTPDFATLAAALAYGLVNNHPFVDGNKRTGFVVCRLFLRINGFTIKATQDDKYLTFYNLAAGQLAEDNLAAWIRERLQ